MITINNDKVFNLDGAIRGMRNPLNSWDKSDSGVKMVNRDEVERFGEIPVFEYVIGENDLKLAKSLVKAGPDHRKFMRQIFVSVDIKAPLYWWKEFDTYKVGTTANSCSTMHKIHDKKFAIDDFSHEHLITPAIDHIECTIEALNAYRSLYLNFDNETSTVKRVFDNDKKNVWWQMIQLLPSSYNQLRTITMNYENLVNMYRARKAHKLDEWREFCKWIETLPYSELITGGKDDAVEE